VTETPASSDPVAPEQGSRVVRVFISSTFRDFGAERDLLMKRVFPELRRRARDRFVEILGIDLRWGITEEQSEQGETLPVCLREIERSRPYFLGFLGQRYGWTPAAGLYPELLLAQQPWLTQHAGGASVTELEILHGVLNAPEMAGRAFFYFRDPSYAQGKGADFASEGDAERSRLALLKDRIRSSPFPVTEYATPEEAADRITEELWRLIDAEYPADDVPDELERTRRSHEAYAAPRRRMYIGQESTLAALLTRLEQASAEAGEDGSRTRMTLVTAESGTGKSALLANGLAAYRQAHPDHPVIEHYTASSGEAADHLQLVRRLSEHIKRLVGSSREIESDTQKLIEQLPEWLAAASFWARKRGVRVILAVDALDRLGDHRWLPRSIPPNVHLVASALPGAAVDAMLERGAGELVALPFTPAVARQFVVQTLQMHGRQLPGRELDRILSHPRATLPIWLKTLVDELSVHGSHEGLSDRITECLRAAEPDDLFEVILARLEADLEPGSVQKPLEAIWASADGMSEDELVRFTGVSPLELARLRLALDEALFEAGGRLHLGHAFVRKGVGDRYLATSDEQQAMHRRLGLWWEQQDPSPRMANELNFQLFRAEAWGDLLRCLTAPRTGVAMVRWVSDQDLYQSWQAIAEHRGSEGVAPLLKSAFADTWPQWLQHWKRADDPAQAMVCCYAMTAFCMHAELISGVALDAAQHGLTLARGLHERNPTPESRRDVSDSLGNVALIEHARGDLDAALAKYQESLEINRQLARELNTPESRRDVSISLDNVAAIEHDRGDLDAALANYYESLGIARQLARELNTPESWQAVGRSLYNVARAEVDHGNDREAREKLQESLNISRQVAIARPSVESAYIIIDSIGQIARFEYAAGDTDAALAKYEEAFAIACHVDQQFSAPWSIRKALISLGDIASIEEARGDLDAALAKYQQIAGTMHQLARELNTPESRRDVSLSLNRVARIEEARGDLDAALAKYQESLELARQLARELNTPQSWRDVSVSLIKVAGIEHARGDLDAALTKYQESLALHRQWAHALDTVGALSEFGRSLLSVALIEEAEGGLEPALAKYEESVAIFRHLTRFAKTEACLRILRDCLGHVAMIQRARGDLHAALAKYQESLEVARQLARELNTPESRRDVSLSLDNVADIEHAHGDLDAALAKYQESLELARQLARELNTPQSRRDVSLSLNNVARIEHARGDLDAALAKYQESLEIARQLYAQRATEHEPDVCNGVVWSAHLTGACLIAMHRPVEALELLHMHAADAAKLEAECGDHPNHLDSCAAFWETFAAGWSAAGDPAEGAILATRAAGIRARIAALQNSTG
jgi:nephrocystin-3